MMHILYRALAHRIRQGNRILANQEKMMDDLTKLTATVTSLEAAVAALKAVPAPVSQQAEIDALDSRVAAQTTEIQSMTPAAPAA